MDGLIALPEMGRHAVFVWSAFALTIAALLGLGIVSLRTLKAREALLARLSAGDAAEPGRMR